MPWARSCPFRLRPTDERLAQLGLEPAQVFTHPSFFDRVPAQTFVVSPASIIDSEFNTAHSGCAQRHAYGSLRAILPHHRAHPARSRRAQVRLRLLPRAGLHGPRARHRRRAAAPMCCAASTRASGACLRRSPASDVTVLVTADHGFIDAPATERVELDDHPRSPRPSPSPCAASAAPPTAMSAPARRAPSRTTCATSWPSARCCSTAAR